MTLKTAVSVGAQVITGVIVLTLVHVCRSHHHNHTQVITGVIVLTLVHVCRSHHHNHKHNVTNTGLTARTFVRARKGNQGQFYVGAEGARAPRFTYCPQIQKLAEKNFQSI